MRKGVQGRRTSLRGCLSRAPGLYCLLFFSSGVRIEVGSLGPVEIPPGTVLYVGSAKGPGGLRARVRRHIKGGKIRWHVDHLTRKLRLLGALTFETDRLREADLLGLLKEAGLRQIVKGFGCSDAKGDFSHLLYSDLGFKAAVSRITSLSREKLRGVKLSLLAAVDARIVETSKAVNAAI